MNAASPGTKSLDLSGQKALVTGANSGIGRGVAIALAEAGAAVVVNYVSGDDAAAEVVDQITRSGGRSYTHRADVSSVPSLKCVYKIAREIRGFDRRFWSR